MRVDLESIESTASIRLHVAGFRSPRLPGDGLPDVGRRDDGSRARVLQADGAELRLDEYAGFALVLPDRGAAAPSDVAGCCRACSSAGCD